MHFKKTRNTQAASQAVNTVGSTRELAGGRLEKFEFEGRRIDVWLPAQYDALTPLLVAHDGGNFLLDVSETWNNQNWGIPEAIASGRIVAGEKVGGRLPIFVGVYRVDDSLRLNELAPEDVMKPNPEMLNAIDPILRPTSPEYRGNDYQDMLALRLVPELARRYGLELAVSRTALMGASLAGLGTIYGVARHPEVFGVGLALSTHWPLGGQKMIDLLCGSLPAPGKVRIYSDCGDIELDSAYPEWHSAFVEKMQKLGYLRDKTFRAEMWPGTGHKESWWAMRVEHPINWWLNG
jgi:hypothetical protein